MTYFINVYCLHISMSHGQGYWSCLRWNYWESLRSTFPYFHSTLYLVHVIIHSISSIMKNLKTATKIRISLLRGFTQCDLKNAYLSMHYSDQLSWNHKEAVFDSWQCYLKSWRKHTTKNLGHLQRKSRERNNPSSWSVGNPYLYSEFHNYLLSWAEGALI